MAHAYSTREMVLNNEYFHSLRRHPTLHRLGAQTWIGSKKWNRFTNLMSKLPTTSELRDLLKISLPLAFGQLGIIGIGTTDNLMLGRLGTDALAVIPHTKPQFTGIFRLTYSTGIL
uniref:MatE protein n=1 Tax=Candidatus Kentrum sp. TUN TaxID=2126343 RepID=A0A451A7P7_9GAMM|nr:MAG: hypothetical protein BECKTUN1418F_GA0071002_12843 [Candidatus Kentron sp. TUN]VFK71641.1 MAG: hypothetical protein BECKTUN1418E_GA0071001_12853 [Candidatus Kentron sp. TUN]